jgi:hypothetical protein
MLLLPGALDLSKFGLKRPMPKMHAHHAWWLVACQRASYAQ